MKHAHTIVVHEPKVIEYLRSKNIKKDDYIHVKGYLRYKKFEIAGGKSKISGYIVAVDIELVDDEK